MKSLFLLLLTAWIVSGATYYVDFDSGDDTAAGTSTGTAFKSVPGTRTTGNKNAYYSDTYGGGTFTTSSKVPAGTIFKIKSGTTWSGGPIKIDSTFYDDGTELNRTVIQRDTGWGSGQIIIDGTATSWNTGGTIQGMVQIWSKYITFDGSVTNGILIRDSQDVGLSVNVDGPAFTVVANVEGSNNYNATFFTWGSGAYCSNVFFFGCNAHRSTSIYDEGSGFYINRALYTVISNCVSWTNGTRIQPNDGADGFHIGSSTNTWIINSIAFHNTEQGFDGSVADKDSGITQSNDVDVVIRNCVGFNNWKHNFDLNSGAREFYYVNCVAHGILLDECCDGNFTIYEGTAGSNFWINCTSTKHTYYGYAFGYSDWNIPASTYYQTMINCISSGDNRSINGQAMGSVRVGPETSSRIMDLKMYNCDLFTVDNTFAVRWNQPQGGAAETNYTVTIVTNGTWPKSVNAISLNPMFVSNATTWANSDLRLQSNSPCLDRGAWPFGANAAGNNSTSLAVTGLVANMRADRVFLPGDLISIGTVTGTVASVTSGTITLTEQKTWSAGDGVWFRIYGTAPDIGAYESTGEFISPPIPSAPYVYKMYASFGNFGSISNSRPAIPVGSVPSLTTNWYDVMDNSESTSGTSGSIDDRQGVITFTNSCTATHLRVGVQSCSGGSAKLALYNSSGNLLSYCNPTVCSGNGWLEVPLLTATNLAAGDYIVAVIVDGGNIATGRKTAAGGYYSVYNYADAPVASLPTRNAINELYPLGIKAYK